MFCFFFFSSRRRHTRWPRDWSSDVCSSDLEEPGDFAAQLLILESEDPDKDVVMYVNSPGGEITGLFAIYDTMQYIKPRSEERRVGKECRSRCETDNEKKKRYQQ